jgi:hypothetical protein
VGNEVGNSFSIRGGRPHLSGRGNFGPLLLILPAAFALGFTMRALNTGSSSGFQGTALSADESADVPDVRVGFSLNGFSGSGSISGDEAGPFLAIRLTPLEAVPAAQAFLAMSWGQQLGLEPGEPWRLELELSADADSLELSDLRVLDAEGLALSTPVLAKDSKDPRSTLLRTLGKQLQPGNRRQVVLWGRAPGAQASLVVGEMGSGEQGQDPATVDLVPTSFEGAEIPRWFVAPGTDLSVGEVGPTGTDQRTSQHSEAAPESQDGVEQAGPAALRIEELELELERLRTHRVERELAWYQYNRALADLNIDAMVAAFAVEKEALREAGLMAEEEPAGDTLGDTLGDEKRTDRERQLERGVRSLLALEGFSGLDLLVLGPSREGGGAGPAVFRMLDDRGRLLGGLNAGTLRLEASHAARTITLVMEDGFESRGGNRVPFSGGSRRLMIPFVDPEPWISALPELFGPEALDRQNDDGLWNLERVRRDFNRLLSEDTSGGWWRLHGLGGIVGTNLRDVQFEQLGENGIVLRRIFADRMRILVENPGLLLVLEDGAVVRGSEKTPFVEGSYRIFLPRALLPDWREANLPGIESPRGLTEESAEESTSDGTPGDTRQPAR